MKEWLHETHGTTLELFRHFLRRFFDSDLVTATGQTTTALIGAFSVCIPLFGLLAQPLRAKYVYLSRLADPAPYREAIRADELWLLMALMSAIGILTAAKCQSLFPGLRDYRALASLPLRPRQIFAAKLAAMLVVATVTIVTLSAVPSLMFPTISHGRWAFSPWVGKRVLAQAAASAAGCYFSFFGLVALQGVLLNLLRPRLFGRVLAYLQGLLVAVLLVLLIMSFSIDPQAARTALRPELASWLPPVWFLALNQAMSGDPDQAMPALAARAVTGLEIVCVATIAAYLVSYRRHRRLMVEQAEPQRKHRRWTTVLLSALVSDPRQQAIVVFLARTLKESGQHRMILMGYGGFGVATLASVTIGIRSLLEPDKVVPAFFIYAHIILLAFVLIGVRHLFSIPTELKANWIFQLTERDGRQRWMHAVDRLVLSTAGVFLVLIPLVLEFHMIGWRAVAESGLAAAFGLFCYECLFHSWEKLPFTCSYLPGKTPVWVVAVQLLAIASALPLVNAVLLACLYNRVLYAVLLLGLLGAWLRLHRLRRQAWNEVRLKYEEAPEPAVHGLELLR